MLKTQICVTRPQCVNAMKYVFFFSVFKQEQFPVSIIARSYPSQCFAVIFTILIQVTVLRAAVTFVNQKSILCI